jgi:transposase InsO family protein
MDIHENVRTKTLSRMLMVERLRSGWSVAQVAAAQGVDPRTVRKWRARHASEGEAGLRDRSSRPHSSPSRTAPATEAEIEALRRQRLSGPAIARRLGRPVSTVGAVLRGHGLGRLAALDARTPVVRYERERPGELIHIDTNKLGRIAGIGHRITGHRSGMVRNRGIGWERLHVAIDDASRLAYTELLPDEREQSAVAFLERALAWFASLGVTVERFMSDNGSAYRSIDFRAAIAAAGLRHIRTRPYTSGPKERPNASSRPACESGHMPGPSSPQPSAQAMPAWLARLQHMQV